MCYGRRVSEITLLAPWCAWCASGVAWRAVNGRTVLCRGEVHPRAPQAIGRAMIVSALIAGGCWVSLEPQPPHVGRASVSASTCCLLKHRTRSLCRTQAVRSLERSHPLMPRILLRFDTFGPPSLWGAAARILWCVAACSVQRWLCMARVIVVLQCATLCATEYRIFMYRNVRRAAATCAMQPRTATCEPRLAAV